MSWKFRISGRDVSSSPALSAIDPSDPDYDGSLWYDLASSGEDDRVDCTLEVFEFKPTWERISADFEDTNNYLIEYNFTRLIMNIELKHFKVATTGDGAGSKVPHTSKDYANLVRVLNKRHKWITGVGSSIVRYQDLQTHVSSIADNNPLGLPLEVVVLDGLGDFTTNKQRGINSMSIILRSARRIQWV